MLEISPLLIQLIALIAYGLALGALAMVVILAIYRAATSMMGGS